MVLKRHFREVITLYQPEDIMHHLEQGGVDVVLLDMNFSPGVTSGKEGLEWLKKIRETDPSVYILMNTAYGEISLAVEAMKLGAIDFMVKPWTNEKLLSNVKNCLALKRSREKVASLQEEKKVLQQDLGRGYEEFIAGSRSMKPVLDSIEKVAPTEAIVLILGENGTGKEMVAREIHRKSDRKDAPIVKVDLGAVPESLFESELFGHTKGAFTDAHESRPGRFEMATGGTLFLDEIGNLDVGMQSKLLSVIQNNEVIRVGSGTPIPIDVRIICATNSSLYEMVVEGGFRQDLLYRINTIELTLPPLRDRWEDIPLLAIHYLKIFRKKYNKEQLRVGDDALDALVAYPWPGNIRELRHSMERAVIMGGGEILVPGDFNLRNQDAKSAFSVTSGRINEIEKSAISKALNKGYNSMDQVAEEVGLSRSTLYRKMKKYGL
ncbi:MAG: sigma-54-dependent Fis family transcriptional regulator [Bacteroidetes bacterium]|nr:sigma-54-dependent Fis family transcriptional regulator [Bacteroidota bacterium]